MTEKHTRTNHIGPDSALIAAILFASRRGGLCAPVLAQAQQPSYPVPGAGFASAPTRQLTLPPLPTPAAITPNGTVVEDVIARVNDQIITRSEYQRAEEQLLDEAQQQGASAGRARRPRARTCCAT